MNSIIDSFYNDYENKIQLQSIQFILIGTDVFVLLMWRKLEYLEETMATCPTW